MNHSPSPERLLLDHCAQELAEAQQLEELMALHSRAESTQVWAKNTQQSLEMRNRAAILRLAVERKTGELLSHMHLRGGDRKSKGRLPL